ncbi:MAG: trehalose-phosphatase [Pseudomonadota bacterium]
MRRLFARANLALLHQFTRSTPILAFDYDGTLAPIVADRERAEMLPRTVHLFSQVCEMYTCAVISGRSRADVAARLGAARVKHISGNHGMEPGGHLPSFERQMSEIRVLLEQRLSGLRGVEIEDKRYSLAVHYRAARRKDQARIAIHHVVDELPVRAVAGKQVVNLLPAQAANKGDALLHLRDVEQVRGAFFIGDDVTDEDVFGLDETEHVFSVRVGHSKKSAAQYFVRDQHEVDRLLEALIEFRASSALDQNERSSSTRTSVARSRAIPFLDKKNV